jgi:hypothetical protein
MVSGIVAYSWPKVPEKKCLRIEKPNSAVTITSVQAFRTRCISMMKCTIFLKISDTLWTWIKKNASNTLSALQPSTPRISGLHRADCAKKRNNPVLISSNICRSPLRVYPEGPELCRSCLNSHRSAKSPADHPSVGVSAHGAPASPHHQYLLARGKLSFPGPFCFSLNDAVSGKEPPGPGELQGSPVFLRRVA